MLLIGVGAKARQGKDEVVTHLTKVLTARGLDARRLAFGDILKCEVYDALTLPEHSYWTSSAAAQAGPKHRYDNLPRPWSYSAATESEKLAWIAEHKQDLGHHLQLYATEFVRAGDKFHFVSAMRAKLLASPPQVALFSDVRFLEEFWYVKSHGGFNVRVTREGYVLNDGRDPNHASETSLDNAKWDYEITAPSGALTKLKNDAEAVFADIERRVSSVIDEEEAA